MDQSDIRDILKMITDAIKTSDWEEIEDVKTAMQEFLDEYEADDVEE